MARPASHTSLPFSKHLDAEFRLSPVHIFIYLIQIYFKLEPAFPTGFESSTWSNLMLAVLWWLLGMKSVHLYTCVYVVYLLGYPKVIQLSWITSGKTDLIASSVTAVGRARRVAVVEDVGLRTNRA